MGIPPISSSSHFAQPLPPSLIQELQHMIQEWRQALADWTATPPRITILQVEKLLEKMKAFLEKNKNEIFAQAKAQGWPEYGSDGYTTYFNGTIDAIQNFMFRPNTASLMFGN
jgi:hypothetical protein